MDPLTSIWLAFLAFGAALINGAVGYGFSSIVTPIAILWYSNKVLNPALVMVEVGVNLTLLVRERQYIRHTWSRARPVVTTLLPGVILGTIGLTYLAINDVKLVVYATLLPLVLLQLIGFYRPFKNERRGGMAVGPGIGFLYALTTISGPPLALFLRNQGMSKDEFRCAIAQIRVAESGLTLGTYLAFSTFFGANLITLPAVSLLPFLVIPVVVGVPLGTLLLRSVSPEFFRRFVMAVDALIVTYGLSRVAVSLNWISNDAAYSVLVAAFAAIAILSWYELHSLRLRRNGSESRDPPPPPTVPSGADP
ncbi:MAG TPA: sulfite exporter TauE/SafE family protein [Thermoplasmata archaeon]|nr:sulfite exporter TauE/SafE family protein [Thermoplasmata archaeon]